MVEKGNLLLSEPFMNDPNFERAVILICDHNEEGTIGFVLNKITDYLVEEVVDSPLKYPLFIGGPVEHSSLHYVYGNQIQLAESVEVKNSLAWGGDFDQLKDILLKNPVESNQIRFFLGYSGWGPGQLQEEFERNSWILYKGNISEIFDFEPDNLWREILKKMGGKYKEMANYPIDPRLN